MAVVLVSAMITLYQGTPITWALYLLVQPLETTNPCNGTGRNSRLLELLLSLQKVEIVIFSLL